MIIKKITTILKTQCRMGEQYVDYYANVTHKAKEILGDCVLEAWQSVGCSFKEDTADEISRMLKFNSDGLNKTPKNRIDCEDGALVLILKNKKIVNISGSGLIFNRTEPFNLEDL